MAAKDTMIQVPSQLLQQAKKGQDAALGAARQIADSVDSAVPDPRPKALEDRIPARKDLIDQAFDVTERVLNAGHGMATVVTLSVAGTAGNVVDKVTPGSDGESGDSAG